jgi:hypothetical protein
MLALGKLMKNDFVLLKLISQTFNDSSPFLSRGRSLNYSSMGGGSYGNLVGTNYFQKKPSALYLTK